MGGANDVWDEIQNDDYLKQIVYKDSSTDQPVSLTSVQAISATLAVSEQLSRLTHGINLLERELHVQVLENHEHLVSQAMWVDRLETILADMQANVQRLLSSVERLRSKVVEPFNKLETQTVMLSRLHATSDLLRRTSRIQQLTKRLANSDAVRAATIINELDELCRDVDLSGLDILQEDLRLMRTETQRVEREAQQMLAQGLNTLSQQEVATAFQVFHSLGTEEREVNQLLEKTLATIKSSAEKALDIQNLNQNSTTQDRNAKAKGITNCICFQLNFMSKISTNVYKWAKRSKCMAEALLAIHKTLTLSTHSHSVIDLKELYYRNSFYLNTATRQLNKSVNIPVLDSWNIEDGL
ncbi:Conserved oligomeric Golgi complex subunit [Homalodisca vitripennis]|nr:Conserved oligomeric Golgi complex subunit [Homalodisca vitripennis]